MDDIDFYFEDLGLLPEMTTTEQVIGGHMSYQKTIHGNDSEHIFVKKFVPLESMSAIQKKHSSAYLEKEASIINQLSSQAFAPEFAELRNGALMMPAYKIADGWFWSVPDDEENRDRYIIDILKTLRDKESLQVDYTHSDIPDTIETLQTDGWEKLLKTTDLTKQVRAIIATHKQDLSEHTAQICDQFAENIETLSQKYRPLDLKELTAFSHHDARINNIAWHPHLGIRIVDWSWAHPGTPQSDSTMFLIDLAKNNIDISDYVDEYFDPKHAYLLLGYWLARALKPTAHHPNVRLHQLASALTAYSLLY